MRTLRERRGAGAARKQVKQVSEMRGLDEAPAARLSRAALAFRAAHATIALEQLLAIAYVWWCALSGRRGDADREGVLVTANGGDCPLGGLQRTPRRPRPSIRAGALAARRETGGADAGGHHRSRACSLDGTRSP
jgi:hypothetical protein